MIRSVQLERLPAGLRFPDELAAKLSFDATRQQLQFDGFMSKTDFDKLVRLHNDLAYQKALQQLFQSCTFSSSSPVAAPRRLPFVFAGLAAAVVAMLTLLFLLRH